ncbi:hypothetical protein [Gracilibacillus alcaliphilus]|uniref:hypothetical protein n=1 Tax=Gracilibacillus alcaliphilus TaxID=1401441 RepID=UPI001957108A|nr:hypothetical protein [Gracilibacillus alcaliphilus]
MSILGEAMKIPVDNFLGMLLYAVIFIIAAVVILGLILWIIPFKLPYALKSLIMFIGVAIVLFIWWNTIASPVLHL